MAKVKEKKKSRLGPVLTAVALIALLLGVGIQVGLGFWRYQQSREAAGLALGAVRETALTQAAGERGRRILIAEDAQEKAEKRLSALAAQKGEIQREKHLELLLLVNPWNELPEGYVPELAPASHWNQMTSGYQLDARAAEDLTQMLNDCMLGGGMPWICSAYRTQDYQQMLFNDKIERLIEEGWSP